MKGFYRWVNMKKNNILKRNIIINISNRKECEQIFENEDMNFNTQYISYFITESIEKILKKVLKNINNGRKEENNCRIEEGIAFEIEGKVVWPNIRTNFYKFLNNHLNNINEINIIYIIGIGGGLGADIKDLCKIVIHSKETNHKGYPHVHIYKCGKEGKGKSVTIGLEDMKIKGNEKIFSAKELKEITRIIEENKKNLIETYKKMIKGERVDSFELEDRQGRTKRIIFKA